MAGTPEGLRVHNIAVGVAVPLSRGITAENQREFRQALTARLELQPIRGESLGTQIALVTKRLGDLASSHGRRNQIDQAREELGNLITQAYHEAVQIADASGIAYTVTQTQLSTLYASGETPIFRATNEELNRDMQQRLQHAATLPAEQRAPTIIAILRTSANMPQDFTETEIAQILALPENQQDAQVADLAEMKGRYLVQPEEVKQLANIGEVTTAEGFNPNSVTDPILRALFTKRIGRIFLALNPYDNLPLYLDSFDSDTRDAQQIRFEQYLAEGLPHYISPQINPTTGSTYTTQELYDMGTHGFRAHTLRRMAEKKIEQSEIAQIVSKVLPDRLLSGGLYMAVAGYFEVISHLINQEITAIQGTSPFAERALQLIQTYNEQRVIIENQHMNKKRTSGEDSYVYQDLNLEGKIQVIQLLSRTTIAFRNLVAEYVPGTQMQEVKII